MHRAVKLALSRGDYELICCDNGTDALRISKESVPSMVIADLDLPGISGAELVKTIKSSPEMANTKVILLCSSIHQGDIGRLDKIPADARLWKPFESEALYTLVLALLRTGIARGGSSTLSTATTQQMQRSAIEPETTRPIQKASTLVDRTMPSMEHTPPPFSQHKERDSSSSITTRDLTENLWTPDFDAPPMKSESTGSREYTSKPSAESKQAAGGDKLSAYREASGQWESIQSRSNVPTPPPPPRAPANAPKEPAISREEIRNIIRTEIQLAFDGWFKEKLEAKLQEILNQIESESKKRV
jgi:DNA-binding response OmpR family regulator